MSVWRNDECISPFWEKATFSRMESKMGIGFPVPHRFNPLCVKSYKINYPFCQFVSFCVASVTSYLVTKWSFHKYLTTPTVLLEERVIETKNTSMYILNCTLLSPLYICTWFLTISSLKHWIFFLVWTRFLLPV